ncbi:sulfotransferase 2B1-like isoform X2 [Eleginops maclovinus]|uniref:sulfotransferase 2B1-like isoform X2 n=1 Tax=Eleginops maclovinus TaxID=56733 RepID=UPI003080C5ED
MMEEEFYTVYKGVYLPSSVYTPESLKYFEEFVFRPDDIITIIYPKSGTVWMQEIVPLIMSGGDPAPVDTIVNWKRVPWLEAHQTSSLKLEQRPSPRLLTTHFHYNMMPSSFFEVKPKVIYVMRNPKDVFTSSFYHHEAASFLDLKDAVGRMAQFLQKSLDHEAIEKIADRCLFKNMRKNNMSNYSTVPRVFMDQTKSEFLRKGIAGDWKNQLTVAEAEYFDTVYKDKMKDFQYKFAWE